MSRLLTDLSDKCYNLFVLFKAKMDVENIPFVVTCTSRTFQEQMALYAQGRKSIIEVNILRKYAGLPLLPAMDKRGDEIKYPKVTWTLASKHIINLLDTSTQNDKANAFDIVITKNKVAIYDLKYAVHPGDAPAYIEAANIGKAVGLRPGAFFSSPDYAHFEC